MIGIPVTKDRLNQVIGGLAQRLKTDFDEIATLKAWSDITSQADIEALGFDADDAELVKLIIAELQQLREIYIGAAAITDVDAKTPTAKDFRVQAQKAIGIGL